MILLYATIFLIAFPNYLPFYKISFFGELSLLKVVTFCAFLYAVAYNIRVRKPGLLLDQPQIKLFFIYLMNQFLSCFAYSEDIFIVENYFRPIAYFLFFYSFTSLSKSVSSAKRIIWIFSIALMLNCYEAIRMAGIVRGKYRAIGFFEDPNYFGSALLIGFGLSLATATYVKNRAIKLTAAVLSLVYIFVMLKTMSRGVLLALSVVIFLYLMSEKIYLLNSKKKIIIVCLMLIGSFVIIKKSGRELFFLQRRIEDTQIVTNEDSTGTVESTSDRYEILLAGIEMIKDSPFVGVGVSKFKENLGNYLVIGDEIGRDYMAHNTYLSVAAEQGIPIFIVFLGIMFYTVRDLHYIYRRSKGKDDDIYWIAKGLLWGFIGYLISIAFLTAEFTNFLWFPIFFTMALKRNYESNNLIPDKTTERNKSNE